MALTEKDLRAIGGLIRTTILEVVPALIKAEIREIPTKDEAAADQDQLMGEFQAMRQEMLMLSNRDRVQEDRITALEEIHRGGDHAH